MLILVLLFSLAILAVDLNLPLGVAGGVPYVLVVLLAQWSTNRRHILVAATLGSILTLVGYFASPEGGIPWIVFTNRGLALFAIWVTALLCYERKGTESQLREEEKRRAFFDAIRESEASLAEAQRIAHLGSWSWDLIENGLSWSTEAYRIFGRAPGSFELTNEAVKSFVHPEDRERVSAQFRSALKSGIRSVIDYRILRPDGKVRFIHLNGHLVNDEEGNAVSMLGTFHDVTDIKRVEQEKRELESRVQQTQKLESLGIMAGGIAHDFNNLLMGIMGNADLAKTEEPLSPGTREFLDEITVSAERAGDLACQMLAYSGRGKTVIQVVDPNELVKEMQTLVSSAIPKSVCLKFDLDEEIPPIECDPTQIRQIIVNLITNAAEAIGDAAGTVTVSSSVETIDPATLSDAHLWENVIKGEYVSITVKDTGHGMDKEVRQKLFDPFFTTKFTGRGLGLSTVLGAVRGHGGMISIESEPAQGALFKVLLPASSKLMEEPDQKEPQLSTWNGQGLALLVDDEEVVRNVTRRMLENLGFSVISAANGYEALDIYRERHLDIVCVLLDMSMPGMDGEETRHALSEIDSSVPAILASGYDEKDVMGRLSGNDFADVIQKPYRTSVLAAKLQPILEKQLLVEE